MKVRLFAFLATLLLLPVHAYAYIDPGTGATLITGILPLIAALGASVLALATKIFWNPIKGMFLKIKSIF